MRTLFIAAGLAASVALAAPSFAMASPENEARQAAEDAAADYKLCVMVWSSRHYDSETFPVEIVRKATENCIDEGVRHLQAARQAPSGNNDRLYEIAFYEALQEVIHLRLTELR